jgi:protein-tyrosine phosphatase
MLTFFQRKKLPHNALAQIGTDMHSHFIPGIDDGAPDMDTSIRMITGLADLGYRKITTTPHIMGDIYRNTHEVILAGRDAVRAELASRKIDIEFNAAAEYFLDDYFHSLLEKDIPLLTLKDNLVLVEFSFVSPPQNFKDLIFALQIKGYQPVIAHPERYLYFNNNKVRYEEMKDAECLFQLNLLSLAGFYGRPTSDLANYLLSQGYIDFVGTDMHNLQHLDKLMHSPSILKSVNKLIDAGKLRNPSL